ncbi:hypothetical protein [Tissierella creatinophila]|uniref:Uncharacterized protein n=1 Tax=Tissierella creatinophila DSM 6911 TaxID=1123403 RepID=A0A1U7M3M9_TISCR|nr:hypothetical protein [Tissierella creatinophila]OLS01923.1 hypothetical protein TICRE_20650 [Tissierella creatinophila DSM 6911]
MENYSTKEMILSETILPQDSEEIFEKIANLSRYYCCYNNWYNVYYSIQKRIKRIRCLDNSKVYKSVCS